MKNILMLAVLVSSLCCVGQSVKDVDAATFKKMIDEKRSVLIDLRTIPEIEKKGMIRGAVKIDFLAKDAEDIIKKLDRNKPYLVYCASGGRSSDCSALMQTLGFANVVNLAKGFDDWLAKGFEVVKK